MIANEFGLWCILGWVIGLLDYGIQCLRLLGSSRPKFFRRGYGSLTMYEDRLKRTLVALDNDSYNFKLASNDIDWGAIKQESGVTIQEARFLSPCADSLPKESAYCQFYMIKPANIDELKTTMKTYVVMLPATGEVDIHVRKGIARKLALEYGWCSVIVTAPYYGCRKPKEQKMFFIDTVQDILMQSQGVIEEAVAICRYVLDDPNSRVCFTGFSYGAAMSGCASTFALKAGVDPSRLSCAVYVGSSSPNVIADGVLEASVHWPSLVNTPSEVQSVTQRNLFDLLNKTQLRNIRVEDKLICQQVVKGIAMTHDLFIRPKYSLQLEGQIQECLNPKFQMKWLPGGHVSGALMRPILHKKLVVDTVQAMAK